jgi:hypothetical protein
MECNEYREQFTQFLGGNLSQVESKAFSEHLEKCNECRAEFQKFSQLWNLLGEMPVPEPSAAMKTEFNEMLSGYKNQNSGQYITFTRKLEELFGFINGRLIARPAFGILMLIIGLIAGYLVHNPAGMISSQNNQIDSLSSQVSEMKQLIMLSLLQDQSASRRIQAVSYTDEIPVLNRKIMDALFTTLNEDPNVNVRLATLEALAKMADDPNVREGLIRSIELQDSPIMQSAIADLMVKLREKKSVNELQKLLERKDINQMVKVNIENSIQKLI